MSRVMQIRKALAACLNRSMSTVSTEVATISGIKVTKEDDSRNT